MTRSILLAFLLLLTACGVPPQVEPSEAAKRLEAEKSVAGETRTADNKPGVVGVSEVVEIKASASVADTPRYALVIGNNDYKNSSQLFKAVPDANLIADTLVLRGYDVVTFIDDANAKQLKEAIRDHARLLNETPGQAVSFFYFAGHGAGDRNSVNGADNFIIPIDADIKTISDLAVEGYSLSAIMNAFRNAKASFVVFDACRDFPPLAMKSGGSNHVEMNASTTGTFIAYATAPNKKAYDNSGFASALADEMNVPGLHHLDVFKNVQIKIGTQTEDRQTPWFSDGIKGRYYFYPLANAEAVTSVGAGAQDPAVPKPLKIAAKPKQGRGLFPADEGLTPTEKLERTDACDARAGHHRDQTLPSKFKGLTLGGVREGGAKKAILACEQAIRADPEADIVMARMHFNYARALVADRKPEGVIPFFQRASELGSRRAQMSLGFRYMAGESGEQSFVKARKQFEAANLGGEPTARTALARFAEYGIGEPENMAKAVELDLSAAKLGNHHRAQYNYAIHVLQARASQAGEAVPVRVAHEYLTRSVPADNPGTTPVAYTQLGWIEEQGLIAPSNVAEARENYRMGRRYGHSLAALALAGLDAERYLAGETAVLETIMANLEVATPVDIDGVLTDAFWLYTPNPHFDEMLSVNIERLRRVQQAENSARLDELMRRVDQQIAKEWLPGKEHILCAQDSDRTAIPLCIGYVAPIVEDEVTVPVLDAESAQP